MSIDREIYRKRLEVYKVDTNDNQIELMKRTIKENFKTNPSYAKDGKINGIDRDFHIVSTTTLKNVTNRKKILCHPDENIKLGDYVSWSNGNWICAEKDPDETIQSTGIIYECNNTLKWQDNELNIHEIPCCLIDKSSYYSEGLESNRYITLADDQILIIIPNNPYTIQIDVGKRFMFGSERNIYEATKIQDLIKPGLLYITMSSDQKGVNDRVDLGLCDYREIISSVLIKNSKYMELNYNNEVMQINTVATKNGIVDDNPSLIYSSSNEYVATVSSTGLITCKGTGNAIITVSYNEAIDTMEVKGIMTHTPVNLNVNIVGDNSINIGQTKSYNSQFMDGGNTVTFESYYWLTADDGVSSTDLATITTQNSLNNTCAIKANSSNKYGYVRLHVQNLQETVTTNKRIHIRSLI